MNKNGLTPLGEQVAIMLEARGAVKFGAFRLKLHDANPNAPLSPFYLNIRNKDNPKPGPLVDADYDLIAICMLETIEKSGIEFDAIAPIPRAGNPIAEAMLRVKERGEASDMGNFRIIMLDKDETGGGRKIVPAPGFEYKEGESILLVDDLVTKAETKIEAINAIISAGSIVVGLAVLADRMQGGKEQLKAAGYQLVASFTIEEMLDFYLVKEKIEQGKYLEAIGYIANN